MARLKKAQPTLDSIFFSSPHQKLMRLLVAEPTTAFNIRAISSRLKGVRGLGGADGINKILNELQQLGLVEFVDNHRAVRVQDDNPAVQILKTFAALCDLEGLQKLLEPISSKGVLFGSRATGRARSDSDYDLFVVSETPDEVKRVAARHPLGKAVEIVSWTPEAYGEIEREDPGLVQKLSRGITMWGSTW